MKITKSLANQIRPSVSGMDWDVARDFIDQYTGNELDCTQLDLLTDWSTKKDTPWKLGDTVKIRRTPGFDAEFIDRFETVTLTTQELVDSFNRDWGKQ